MSITVYQRDARGYFLNSQIVLEDPYTPGYYPIPAGCTTIAPPVSDGLHVPFWTGDSWIMVDPPSVQTYPTAEAALAAERAAMELSFSQTLTGLEKEQWITTQEAYNWLMRVSLPALVTGYINSLPEDQRFAVTSKCFSPSTVYRTNAIVNALAAAKGKTAEDIDKFFRDYKSY